MQKGFNTDIDFKGMTYHIQTEDWGVKNPFFVSRIFCQGAVVRSVKTSYEEVLPEGMASSPQTIQTALKYQHQSILDLLLSGQLL